MNRVIHFEIPARDPEAMISFFTNVFGWKFQLWEGPMEYWTITTGPDDAPGINGGMMRENDSTQPVVNTSDVADIDATAALVEANGGTVVVPKMPIPGIGWLIYFTDPRGNIHGAMQTDPAAGS